MQIAISALLEKAYDVEAFRQLGHELIDLMASHLEALQSGKDPIAIPYEDPEDQLRFWQQDLQKGGTPLAFFEQVLQRSTRVHHPRYIGHQVGVPALLSTLAGMLSDLLNNGMAIYEMGMVSTALERLVLEFMAQQIGYENGGGCLTSGGSLANLTALLAARKAKAPSPVWEAGHAEKLAVFVSEEAHYCIDKAARIMGLGDEGIILIPSDDRFKIRLDVLQQQLEASKAKGYHPIAVIGCAASTSTGSYDDLNALADFAEQHQLWFHIDGAHGGAVIFSEKYKHLAAGIERADSVIIDFHKLMLTPALNTAIVFKEEKDSYKTFQQEAHYLWTLQQAPEWYHSGKKTFECTKLMLSMKFYILLRTYGPDLFRDYVETVYNKARIFAQMLKQHPSFELALEPESNIVNFRFVSPDVVDLNQLNAQILKELITDGRFYIVQTVIRGKRYLRSTIMNAFTQEADFKHLLGEISRWGSELAQKS